MSAQHLNLKGKVPMMMVIQKKQKERKQKSHESIINLIAEGETQKRNNKRKRSSETPPIAFLRLKSSFAKGITANMKLGDFVLTLEEANTIGALLNANVEVGWWNLLSGIKF